jgi:hypothetical protein
MNKATGGGTYKSIVDYEHNFLVIKPTIVSVSIINPNTNKPLPKLQILSTVLLEHQLQNQHPNSINIKRKEKQTNKKLIQFTCRTS